MTPRLDMIQQRLFGAADGVCLERARLVTEAWQEHAAAPRPVRRARALAHVLENMSLDLQTNPVFAGNTSSRPGAWMLLPEHGIQNVQAQVAIEHSEFRGFLDGKIPQELIEFWRGLSSPGGLGHLCVDYNTVVHHGLRSVLDRLVELAQEGSEEQQTYREAMRITLAAVINWAHRYAEASEHAAAQPANGGEADCHRRVAEACRHVPEHPARNLFEGLQAIALVHLAISIEGHHQSLSIGLPDRVLSPFAAEADNQPDATADLVAAFALKIAMNTYTGRGSKTQCITVGGRDRAGTDCCNAVTTAFLDGFDRVAVSDPHLFLRWHPDVDPGVLDRALEMLSHGRSMPLLINDEQTARGLVNAGVRDEDAWQYSVMGCNELGIPGLLFDSALPITCTWIDIEYLSRVLESDTAREACSTEELVAQLEPFYGELPKRLAAREKQQQEIARYMPTPFTSALMLGGPERGCDLMVGMPYRIPCVYNRGLTNAANALAAIQKIVFEDGVLTLAQLVQAAKQNKFDARTKGIIAAAPKWGSDDPAADRWMTALIDLRRKILDRMEAEGQAQPVVCHVIRSLHHLSGAQLGATLDGRDAGAPLADSIGAVGGTSPKGPGAVLNSVLKINAARDFRGGYNLNLTLPATQAAPATLAALVTGFFGQGGQELQINVLSAARLHEARENPEKFRNLVVRVAGLNARFVELSREEQQELIQRAEAAEASSL